MLFCEMNEQQLRAELAALREEYAAFAAQDLKLNMARGKPGADQLALSMPLLDTLSSDDDYRAEDGTDCRNYGVLDGLPEAKRLMAGMLDDEPENVIVFGQGSLNIMYDAVARYWMFGALGSAPWCSLPQVKWLCPSPGYDRHFAISQSFGIKLIPVDMNADGPNMDEVERLAASDEAIKGIWCVPQYSNPGGVTYSDEVVRRLGTMDCAAEDFRIFWDNAYCVHHLFDEAAAQDHVADIADACVEAGYPDRYLKFVSTSKVTFPGAGLAALAASPANVAEIKARMGVQTIGHDKLNQLRHVRFLRDDAGIAAHMARHAALLRPKFALVDEALHAALDAVGGCTWSTPRGGYFISFDAPEGCATRAVALAKEAGVTLTGAGATWPYKRDPHDSNIRIAPTMPPLDELARAMEVFVCCVKLAYCERLLGE